MEELLRSLGVPSDPEDGGSVNGLLDAFPGHVAILDADGRILATNERWRRFQGEAGDGAAGYGVGDNYRNAYRRVAAAGSPGAADVAAALEQVLDGRRHGFHSESPWHSPTERRWFMVRMAAIMDGPLRRVLVTHEDITPLKASRDANDLLATVAARTANGVVITDAQQRIEWVNDAFTMMTGYARNEVVGRRPGAFLQGEGSEGPALQRIREACRIGESVTATILNYRKSGEPFIVELRVDPVRDAAGTVTHFIAIQVDVTDAQERAEEVAAAAQAERERLAAELHDGLGQELTGAALLVTAGLAALPPDAAGVDALRRGIAAIQRATASARELAHGTAPAHMHQGLRHSLEALAWELSVPGKLVVRVHVDADASVSGARAHHLYRISQEAVANAIRHGHATSIAIELRHTSVALVLSIDDDGCGIAANVSGFGLRMMGNRAKQLHGELTIGRGARGGTRVECVVPREVDAVARTRARAQATSLAP
jgi:PAS domain S-box-containing protein